MAAAAWLGSRRHEQGRPVQAQASLPWLIGLSYLGLYSHVFLDYLNNYGVRLLAPFDWRWFYGDAVFIIDPWLWIVLGTGIWVARRTTRPAAARGALAFATCYVALMLGSSHAARGLVLDSWSRDHGSTPTAVMVGPTPVVPFLREVIIDGGDHYETGRFSWLSAGMRLDPNVVQKHDDRPETSRARDVPHVRAFLAWSRFPYWELQEERTGTRVTVRDMRFGDRFAASTLVPR
jgi:inner membrane protein